MIMTNAREEFEEVVEGGDVLCAWICFIDHHHQFPVVNRIYLKKGYTPQEYKEFLQKIDRVYNSGFGRRELEGTIWLTNGIWIERHEYGGSEHWEYRSPPSIPDGCEGPLVKSAGKTE